MIPMPDKPLDQALLEGGEIDLKEINFDPELLKLISPAQARKYCILPLQKKGTVLQLIGPSPLTHEAVEELEYFTGCAVGLVLGNAEEINKILDIHYGIQTSIKNLIEGLEQSELAPLKFSDFEQGIFPFLVLLYQYEIECPHLLASKLLNYHLLYQRF
jgi:hypothetical protein